MSWDSYIPNLQANITPAPMCWLGGKDGSKWASSNEKEITDLTPEQAVAIVKGLADQSNSVFPANGITIGAVKFMFLRKDNNLALGKKKDHGFVTAAITKSALIVCIGREGTQHGDLNKNVSSIAEYLEGAGM